jgi:TolA-binding protein
MRRFIPLGVVVVVGVAFLWAADDKNSDTAAAAAARKKLKTKVTVEYKGDAFRDVVDDLKGQVKGLSIRPDTKSGVQLNTKITYKAKDATLEKVLNDLCEKNGWGYYIKSKEKDAYDGQVVIKVGDERGYEKGKEPPKDGDKPKDKEDSKDKAKDKPKDKAKDKPKDKPKDAAKPKDKDEEKDKTEPKDKSSEDDSDKAERAAALKLKSAKGLIKDGKVARAKEILKELIKKYPKTKAADDAKELLDSLKE